MRSRCCYLLICLVLTGCAVGGNSVSAGATQCCPDADASTYHLVTENLPAFLAPIVVNNVHAALAAAGYQQVEAGELLVTVRYEQDNLAMNTRLSGMDERVSEGGDVRYVARIVIELRDDAGEVKFQGAIDRLHEVSPGEYMHTGRASLAIFDALTDMFRDLRRGGSE